MNWLNELYDLYEKNQYLAGEIELVDKKAKNGSVKTSLVLLPISHTTVTAQITVTIDTDGNFISAEPVAEEDKLTIIPVTAESGSRTAGKAPHPLCDNLKYLAGDYMDYYGGGKNGKEKNFSENYQMYIKALQCWSESEYSHEKVNSIYRYLRKGRLIQDLVGTGVIRLDEQGKIAQKEKIQAVAQEDAFVRFRVWDLGELDEGALADRSGNSRAECWKDKTLQKCFIEYYRSLETKKGLSYLSGNVEALSFLQPKKIRNEGDGAKLISSNDEQNFTFRGRFSDKSQAFSIGYEDSQKAHNALKWIIRKQGYSWDSLYVVIWESDMKPLPCLHADTDEIGEDYEGLCEAELIADGDADMDEIREDYEGWGDEEEQTEYLGTDEIGASRFAAAMRGYGKCLGQSSRTVLLAFDSATPGRLAMTECKQFESSTYLQNIFYWHMSCEWQHVKYKKGGPFIFQGMVGVDEIAEALYATEEKGRLTITGKNNQNLYKEVLKRLLPCISERRKIPLDLVRLAVQRASSPMTFKERYNWERILAVACSFVKKQRYEYSGKEVWKVALDTRCDKRDYLFGRLLAVADRVEYRTYDKDDWRETNAQRYMAVFAQKPMRTWKVLEEKLQPYWGKLKPGERIVYKKLIDEIFDKFTVEAYEKDESLSGLYLLGFHSQAIALKQKAVNEQKEEE